MFWSSVIYILPCAVTFFVGFYFLVITKMAKAGSPFFKIGYFLYTNTPVGHVYYRKEVDKAAKKFKNEPHSISKSTQFNDLNILPICISMDNYCYLITDKKSNTAVLVDPADPEPIQRVLDKCGVVPTAILTTHKHWDHSDGNSEWKKKHRSIEIYGGALDHVPGATHHVREGDHIQVGPMTFHVYFTPGHTVGHVVYVLDGTPYGAPPQLFSGDHLFLGGIGRMFEGTPSQMLHSLDKMESLPDNTLLWPGHEYAADNLEFAMQIDSRNVDLIEKLDWVTKMRKGRQTTCPSTIGEEKRYNPFLRTKVTSFLESLGFLEDGKTLDDEIRAAALKSIRARKDKFKYKL